MENLTCAIALFAMAALMYKSVCGNVSTLGNQHLNIRRHIFPFPSGLLPQYVPRS